MVLRILKRIIYECGCSCDFEIYNKHAAVKKWHVRSECLEHLGIARSESQVESDWMTVVRELYNEHDAILYLTEKGYEVRTVEIG